MAQAETDPLTRPRLALPIQVSAITAILALALGLIAGAGAALYQRARPTHYQSSAVLLIDEPSAIAIAPDNGPLLKIQQLRYFYAGLLRTEVIAGPISQQVNLPAGEVESDLSAVVDPASFTLQINSMAKSPAQSSTLAQAAAAELISYVAKQQATLGLAPINRVVLTEVTTPQGGVKVSQSTTKVLVSGLVAFFVVGLGFVIAADLLRRRW